MKHGKCRFVPHDVYSRMRTTNLNLMMQKGCRVVQMLIAHKRFDIIYIFKRWGAKNKVALAVEFSILRSSITSYLLYTETRKNWNIYVRFKIKGSDIINCVVLVF